MKMAACWSRVWSRGSRGRGDALGHSYALPRHDDRGACIAHAKHTTGVCLVVYLSAVVALDLFKTISKANRRKKDQ